MFGSKTKDIATSPPASPDGPSKSSPTIEEFSLGKRGILVFFTLSVLTLMVALDGTSISVALPVRMIHVKCLTQADEYQIISRDLDGSAIEAFWSGTSFLLCSTGNSNGPLDHIHYLFLPSVPTKLHFLLQHIWPKALNSNGNSLLLCRYCCCFGFKELYLHARGPFYPRCRRRWTHCPERSHRHRSCPIETPRQVFWSS